MQLMSIMEQMKHMEQFSESEQQIIRYLLNSPETILDVSVRELAQVCYTSPSTVTRLVNKLNDNKGFNHFKATFFNEMNTASISASNQELEFTSGENAYSIIQKVSSIEIATIEQTKQSIDYEALARISNLINASSQVQFFGFDNNLNIAKNALYRMMSIGKQVVIHDATNAQFYQAISSPAKSVAIIVSRTGENRKLVDLLQILGERKIPRIVLTPVKDSSVGKLSDYYLQVINDLQYELVGNIVFDTSLQYLFNILCGILCSRNYECNREIHEMYHESMDNIY